MTDSTTRRLDVELPRRGLARSRTHAAGLITSGAVLIDGRIARKASTPVTDDTRLEVNAHDNYVSRAARKLAGALDDFGFTALTGRALDVGASTGGFTQVLLERGIEDVTAVDVGHGQLAPELAADTRVSAIEGLNARELTPMHTRGPVDVCVADLSFISLTLVVPAIAGCCAPAANAFLMVKPQFELSRSDLDAHGVVRGRDAHARAVRNVADAARRRGFTIAGASRSRLPGPSGNLEYFLWLTLAARPARSKFDLDGYLATIAGG